jgi:hypothetical protein
MHYIFLLSRVELGEESEGLPGVLDALLQHGTQGGLGGICDECRWRGCIGVCPSLVVFSMAVHQETAMGDEVDADERLCDVIHYESPREISS